LRASNGTGSDFTGNVTHLCNYFRLNSAGSLIASWSFMANLKYFNLVEQLFFWPMSLIFVAPFVFLFLWGIMV